MSKNYLNTFIYEKRILPLEYVYKKNIFYILSLLLKCEFICDRYNILKNNYSFLNLYRKLNILKAETVMNKFTYSIKNSENNIITNRNKIIDDFIDWYYYNKCKYYIVDFYDK